MSSTPTVIEVIEFTGTNKPNAVIQSLITFMEAAEPCLLGAGLDEESRKLIKIYAIAHQLELMSGGQVTSESNIAGASVSYATPTGMGLASTTWGMLLKGMAGASCIEALINKSDIQVFSVGRRCR
jgi:hypothetical protein